MVVVLRIYISLAVVAIVSCPLPLDIFLSSSLGVPGGLPMFSPSLGIIMRVHMGVGDRGQGYVALFIHDDFHLCLASCLIYCGCSTVHLRNTE